MSPYRPLGPLFTDLYELTMAAAYWAHGIRSEAVFSAFIRGGVDQRRGYFVMAGLQDVIDELAAFRFSQDDLTYLGQTGLFEDDFLLFLKKLRFTGRVDAMAEGTVFFHDEPILEISAPLIEAQIIETFVLNTLGFQTLIASKAARCTHAAGGRPLIDFSLRRTQGADAGLKVARSTYLAGFEATSNVLAGRKYGIPVSGTMAHSFVMAFDSEPRAFAAYAETFPENAVFLIDTYDTVKGAHQAAAVGLEMRRQGHTLKGVRLDSGDMVTLSRRVRHILNEAGLPEVKVFASSGLDEFLIADVLAKGAAIDAFGVGTKVGVSADAPYVDIVYKLVRCGGRNVRKVSPGKTTLAGAKQVFRRTSDSGYYVEDIVGLRDETLTGARPLLETVMSGGIPSAPPPALSFVRDACGRHLGALDNGYKDLTSPAPFPVRISPRLRALQG